MFDDVLGERKVTVMNKESVGDTKPSSFAEVWAAKQKQIEAADEADNDDFADEYEGLQI